MRPRTLVIGLLTAGTVLTGAANAAAQPAASAPAADAPASAPTGPGLEPPVLTTPLHGPDNWNWSATPARGTPTGATAPADADTVATAPVAPAAPDHLEATAPLAVPGAPMGVADARACHGHRPNGYRYDAWASCRFPVRATWTTFAGSPMSRCLWPGTNYLGTVWNVHHARTFLDYSCR